MTMRINEELKTDAVYVRELLRDEEDAIASYQLAAQNVSNLFVQQVLIDIMNEEKVHVGELIEVLKTLGDTDSKFMEEGQKEAKELINKFDKIIKMSNDIVEHENKKEN